MEKVETNGNRAYSLPLSFFLAGLGTGIAVAALLAPHSGPETRRLIGSKVEEGEDWVKSKAAAAQGYVSSHGVALGDRVKEVAEVIGRS
jgi:gas vesicle protein